VTAAAKVTAIGGGGGAAAAARVTGCRLGLGRRCVGETQRDELVGQHGIKKVRNFSQLHLWSFESLKRAQIA